MMPVIPHFANECIVDLKNQDDISWPTIDKNILEEEETIYVIQINGKKRGLIKTEKDKSENDLLRLINEYPEINKYMNASQVDSNQFPSVVVVEKFAVFML